MAFSPAMRRWKGFVKFWLTWGEQLESLSGMGAFVLVVATHGREL